MCFSDRQIDNRCKKIKDLQSQVDALQLQIDTLKEELKKDMENESQDRRETNNYKLSYTTVTQNKFDTTGFKKAMPDMYKLYSKVTSYKRFLIA